MKEKIITILFVSFLLGLGILSLLLKDQDLSFLERRNLIQVSSLKKDFPANLDNYMEDQFPFRNSFIFLNSLFDRFVLLNEESNNVYIKNDTIIEKNYPLDEKSVNNFIKKINYIADNYLKDSNSYLAIIPDKSLFLEDNYLKIDFESLEKTLSKRIHISYIDIASSIKLDDFYKTDIHLKQNAYFKIIDILNDNFQNQKLEISYEMMQKGNFAGASYSKAPFVKKDTLEYYITSDMANTSVNHLEFGLKDIYDEEAFNNVDNYDVFLSGPSSLITINNQNATSGKKLIIFRDSFSSSMAPLLIPYYEEITLIDLRYISFDNIKDKITFTDRDVLFLYSTLITNNSSILKVNTK